MLAAYDFIVGSPKEIVIAGKAGSPEIKKFITEIFGRFNPNKVVLFHPEDKEEAGKIEAISPFIKNQISEAEGPIVFVCQNYICKLPTSDVNELRKQLAS